MNDLHQFNPLQLMYAQRLYLRWCFPGANCRYLLRVETR